MNDWVPLNFHTCSSHNNRNLMNITQVPVSLQFRHKYTTQVINLFHGDAGFKAAHMAFNQPSTFFIFFFFWGWFLLHHLCKLVTNISCRPSAWDHQTAFWKREHAPYRMASPCLALRMGAGMPPGDFLATVPYSSTEHQNSSVWRDYMIHFLNWYSKLSTTLGKISHNSVGWHHQAMMHDSGFDWQERGLLIWQRILSKWTKVAGDEIRTGDREMSDPIKMENCLRERQTMRETRISTFLLHPIKG